MLQAVPAADRLRHRVGEREHRAGERLAAVAGAAQELCAQVTVERRLDDARQERGDEARALERVLVRVLVVAVRVQRLRAVGERVHRRPHRLLARKTDREADVVDDAAEPSAAPAPAHAPTRVAHAEERRPLRARVRRRDGDERHSRRRRDRLAEIDRAAAADGDDTVARRRRRLVDARGRHLVPARGRLERQLERIPACARDEERRADTELVAHFCEQRDRSPADDHCASLLRAKSTNACATRVSARPLERASEISRAGSSPSTRAIASAPDSTSASIAAFEMNVAP